MCMPWCMYGGERTAGGQSATYRHLFFQYSGSWVELRSSDLEQAFLPSRLC